MEQGVWCGPCEEEMVIKTSTAEKSTFECKKCGRETVIVKGYANGN